MFDFWRAIEIITGLFYFIYGVDGFFKKIPLPEPSPEALEFLQALEKARYLLPAVKVFEIAVGLCFIFAWQGPLAWCLLSPIVFNILAYQLFLNKKEWLLPIGVAAMHLLLMLRYLPTLSGLLLGHS